MFYATILDGDSGESISCCCWFTWQQLADSLGSPYRMMTKNTLFILGLALSKISCLPLLRLLAACASPTAPTLLIWNLIDFWKLGLVMAWNSPLHPVVFLHNKEMFCYFSSFLVNAGHFQLASNISTTSLLVELVAITHGYHILSCYYWKPWGDVFIVPWLGTLWYLRIIFSNIIIFSNKRWKMIMIERTHFKNDNDDLP